MEPKFFRLITKNQLFFFSFVETFFRLVFLIFFHSFLLDRKTFLNLVVCYNIWSRQKTKEEEEEERNNKLKANLKKSRKGVVIIRLLKSARNFWPTLYFNTYAYIRMRTLGRARAHARIYTRALLQWTTYRSNYAQQSNNRNSIKIK